MMLSDLRQTRNLESARSDFTRALAIITIIVSIGGLFAQSFALRNDPPGFLEAGVPTAMMSLCGFIALALVQRKREAVALALIIVALVLAYLFAGQRDVSYLLGVMCLVAAATHPRLVLFVAVNLIIFGRLFFEIVQIIRINGLEPTPEGGSIAVQISALFILSVTVRFFIGAAENTTSQARRTANLLRASSQTGQEIANFLEMKQLFAQSVNLIRDQFDYYHVQVFLLDDARDAALLVASTGEVGQKLLARGHKLAVGSRSVVGRVTLTGEPYIVGDTKSDSTHAANPLLPETRSEIALPILEGDRIIGALDVQSKYPGAFLQSDVQALQVMSNLLGTAIRNARLYETQVASVQDNKRLLFESETNLREIQRLNRQLTRKAWEEYQRTRFDALGVTLSAQGVQPGASWTDEMIDAVLRQRPIVTEIVNDGVIAVPIVLRGEVLGAIEVAPGTELRPDDTVELIQSVAQRLALSLDNARLFEETQEATVQEQRINDIVARYQSAATVDDLLQITLAELSQSLGAAHGAIRLGSLPASHNGHQNGHDNGTHSTGHRANGGSA